MTAASPPDPMRSFRGVMVAALVLEAIVVLLALPVVAKLGDGLGSWRGLLVGVLALALLLACGTAGRPWGIILAAGLQVVLIVCWFAVPVLGIIGVIFAIVWATLLWMRHDVAKRMAQQESTSD